MHPRHAPSPYPCSPCCPPGQPRPRPGREEVSIEFIGIAATAPHSETEIASERTDPVQPGYLEELARAHEEAGFDRVLVAHSSASPDGFTVADQVLARTERLGVLLAHRPGFVAPTYAARKFATLDAFHPGRVALHVITGGDDADQARDGDLTGKVTRYRRTDEFLGEVLNWSGRPPPRSITTASSTW